MPIYINLDKFPPVEKLLIETRIPIFPDLKLDYGTVSDYSITVENNNVFVYLSSNELPVIDDRITNLDFIIREEDTAYFKFNSDLQNLEV